jgi:HEAT repeat protein
MVVTLMVVMAETPTHAEEAEISAALQGHLEALRDENASVRYDAVKSLGREGRVPRAAILGLIDVLDDEQQFVRSAAVDALADLGQEPKLVVPAMAKLLKDGDKLLRCHVLLRFGAFRGYPEVLMPPLVGALGDKSEMVRVTAAMELASLGPRAADAGAVLLRALAKDPGDETQLALLRALQAVSKKGEDTDGVNATVGGAIDSALQSGDLLLTIAAARAAASLGWRTDEALRVSLRALNNERCPLSGRVSAVRTLALLRGHAEEKRRCAVAKELSRPESAVRAAAVRAVPSLDHVPEGMVRALVHLLEDPAEDVRLPSAVYLLNSAAHDSRAAAVLVNLLSSRNVEIRREVVDVLGALKRTDEAIIRALEKHADAEHVDELSLAARRAARRLRSAGDPPR